MHIYSSETGKPQKTNVQTLLQSSLVIQRALLGLLTRTWVRSRITAEKILRQPHHQNPSVFAGLKAGNLERTVQPTGSSTG